MSPHGSYVSLYVEFPTDHPKPPQQAVAEILPLEGQSNQNIVFQPQEEPEIQTVLNKVEVLESKEHQSAMTTVHVKTKEVPNSLNTTAFKEPVLESQENNTSPKDLVLLQSNQ